MRDEKKNNSNSDELYYIKINIGKSADAAAADDASTSLEVI